MVNLLNGVACVWAGATNDWLAGAATMLTCGVGRFRSPHHCYAGLHSSCSAPTLHAIKPLRYPSYSLTGTLNPGSLLT